MEPRDTSAIAAKAGKPPVAIFNAPLASSMSFLSPLAPGRPTHASAHSPAQPQVVQNERQLRDLLIRDGYPPIPGYQLARYKDPSTPPSLRRNEVLIFLDNFTWPEPAQ